MSEWGGRRSVWTSLLITVLIGVSGGPSTVRGADNKTGGEAPKGYRALCEAIVTGNVKEVLVTDKPSPGINKRAVVVLVLTADGKYHALWIDLDSKSADLMLTNVRMAVDKSYPVRFNEGAIDPESGMPKKAVDTVVLVDPRVGSK